MENYLKRLLTCTTQCCQDTNVLLYVVKDLQLYCQRLRCNDDCCTLGTGSISYVFAAAWEAQQEIKQIFLCETSA